MGWEFFLDRGLHHRIAIFVVHNNKGQGMKKLVAAALLGIASTSWAGYGSLTFSDFAVGDGYDIIGGAVHASLRASDENAARASDTEAFAFAGWPQDFAFQTTSGGAIAGFDFDADHVSAWGDSGDSGAFGVSLTFLLLVAGDPGSGPMQLDVGSFFGIMGVTPDRSDGAQVTASCSTDVGGRGTTQWCGRPTVSMNGRGEIGSGWQHETAYSAARERDPAARSFAGRPLWGVTYSFKLEGTHAGDAVASPIPEPSTYAMMFAGLAAVGLVAGRRGRRGAASS